jgi:hypothetical protein
MKYRDILPRLAGVSFGREQVLPIKREGRADNDTDSSVGLSKIKQYACQYAGYRTQEVI